MIRGDHDKIDLEGLTKSLKSLDVNCVQLSNTRQSTTPNLAHSSWRKLIVTSVVGFPHLRNSGYFEKLSTTIR